jgi:hypothetical protein
MFLLYHYKKGFGKCIFFRNYAKLTIKAIISLDNTKILSNNNNMTLKFLSIFTILTISLMGPALSASAQIRPNINPYIFNEPICNPSVQFCNDSLGITEKGCQFSNNCQRDIFKASPGCSFVSFTNCYTDSPVNPILRTINTEELCTISQNCEPKASEYYLGCGLFGELCELKPSTSIINNDCEIFSNCFPENTSYDQPNIAQEPITTLECSLFAFNCPFTIDCISPIFVQPDPCYQPNEISNQTLSQYSQIFCSFDESGFPTYTETQEECESTKQYNNEQKGPTNCYSVNSELCDPITEPTDNCEDAQDGPGYNKCNSQDIFDNIQPGFDNTPESFFIGLNKEFN